MFISKIPVDYVRPGTAENQQGANKGLFKLNNLMSMKN
jgi:hypothetical protein